MRPAHDGGAHPNPKDAMSINAPITGTRIRPPRTQGGYRTCHRCGIDFPLNSRSVWTRQTHCKDCRHYQRQGES